MANGRDRGLFCSDDEPIMTSPGASPTTSAPPPVCGPPELSSPSATSAADDATQDMIGRPYTPIWDMQAPEAGRAPTAETRPPIATEPEWHPTAEQQREWGEERARRQAAADEATRRLDQIMERDRQRREAAHPGGLPRHESRTPREEPAPAERPETPGFEGIDEHVGDHGPYIRAGQQRGPDDQVTGIVLEAGVVDGASHEDPRRPGETVDGSLINVEMGAGGWTDREGRYNGGVHVAGNTGSVGFETDHGDIAEHERLQFGGPNVDVSAYANDDGVFVGAQAAAGEVSFEGSSGAHADRQDDYSWRVGASEGPGGGGRILWGDHDGDGAQELGFGFDAGPASFDVRSEWAGRQWNAARDWWNED